MCMYYSNLNNHQRQKTVKCLLKELTICLLQQSLTFNVLNIDMLVLKQTLSQILSYRLQK